MDEPNRANHDAPPLPAAPAPWRALWTNWPGSGEPLLLLTSPGQPYRGGPGFTLEQSDAWYCHCALRMASWKGGPGEQVEVAIPPLTAVTVHVGRGGLRLRAAARDWLQPASQDCGPDDHWSAVHLGRTILGVLFAGPTPGSAPSFQDFFLALHAGDALVGDAPVIVTDDLESGAAR